MDFQLRCHFLLRVHNTFLEFVPASNSLRCRSESCPPRVQTMWRGKRQAATSTRGLHAREACREGVINECWEGQDDAVNAERMYPWDLHWQAVAKNALDDPVDVVSACCLHPRAPPRQGAAEQLTDRDDAVNSHSVRRTQLYRDGVANHKRNNISDPVSSHCVRPGLLEMQEGVAKHGRKGPEDPCSVHPWENYRQGVDEMTRQDLTSAVHAQPAHPRNLHWGGVAEHEQKYKCHTVNAHCVLQRNFHWEGVAKNRRADPGYAVDAGSVHPWGPHRPGVMEKTWENPADAVHAHGVYLGDLRWEGVAENTKDDLDDAVKADRVHPRSLCQQAVTKEQGRRRHSSGTVNPAWQDAAKATCKVVEDELLTYGVHPDDAQWTGVTKVMIRNIPTRCRIGELDQFIAESVEGYVSVSLPMKSSRKNRGYAFVRTEDASVARAVVTALWKKTISSRLSDRPLVLHPAYDDEK
eukprot:gb/GFBE01052859.1/.p1 GENE.gb/GFBE01052859.1/~~gb/GFBE01052859.1/.p1  ORF type:complete len:467 (+),score=54.32 gb/GFBE01052859.1/:1-1401(+)